MIVFALDLSTNAGYAVLESDDKSDFPKLLEYGTISMFHRPEWFGRYPNNFISCANDFATALGLKIRDWPQASVLVVEETVPGRETYSQKLLEFLHFSLISYIQKHNPQIKIVYIRTGEWRKTVEARMTKTELKGNIKKNREKTNKKAKELRDAIKKLGTKKVNKLKAIELKQELSALQLGKVTRKHVSVRIANKLFGLNLKLKDNDISDSLLLGLAYFKGAKHADGVRPMTKKK